MTKNNNNTSTFIKNKYGLCCISLQLKTDQNLGSGTITKKKFVDLAAKNLQSAINFVADKTLHNLYVTRKTLELCAKHNWNYRISSDIFPLYTLPEFNVPISQFYNFSQKVSPEIDRIKTLVRTANIRCSMHPDQYVVPASGNTDVVAKSIRELNYHGEVMDLFGLSRDYNSPINIHMNSFNSGTLEETAARFVAAFHKLSDSVKSRLVLECEDKPNSWDVTRLFDVIVSKLLEIPITYDSHHFRLNNPKQLSYSEAAALSASTWKNCKPLFHFSNGKASPADRAHSDYVYEQHNELFDMDVDVDFEFKQKDLAILAFEQNIKS
jgi:UV DNA damage endonuclease